MNNRIARTFQSIRLQSLSLPLTLKVGQMVQGKVLKFLPQNRAFIQVGNQTVIADLKNALQLNERYLFQVKQVTPQVHLQVVTAKPIRTEHDTIQQLLRKWGFKETDTRREFLSLLIRHEAPMKEEVVKQALQLLDTLPDKKRAPFALLEMVKREFPITKNVFDLVFQRMFKPISFSKTTESLLHALQTNNVNHFEAQQLAQILSGLIQKGNVTYQQIGAQIIHEVLQQSPVTFQLLQKAGFLPTTVTFSDWKEMWLSISKDIGKTTSQSNLMQLVSEKNLPLSFQTVEEFLVGMKKLWDNRHLLTKQEKAQLLKFLLQGLPMLEKQSLVPLKESIQIKLQGFFSIVNADYSQANSVQDLLLNIVKESNQPIVQREGTSLLQIFQSIVLSKQEQMDWQQFSYQLPGALFGLKEDVWVDVEGKNGKDGQIGDQFVRIMFYLHMESLKETIVDMKVQKQLISLSIFHQHPERLMPIVHAIQPKLINQLKEKNYHISTIKVVPLHESESDVRDPYPTKPSLGRRGVDLQI